MSPFPSLPVQVVKDAGQASTSFVETACWIDLYGTQLSNSAFTQKPKFIVEGGQNNA